jgi:hypothetical protein
MHLEFFLITSNGNVQNITTVFYNISKAPKLMGEKNVKVKFGEWT